MNKIVQVFLKSTCQRGQFLQEFQVVGLYIFKKMKFSIKDFFSKCDQILRELRIWLYLLKKSLMQNFIFYAVVTVIKWTTSQVISKDFANILS